MEKLKAMPCAQATIRRTMNVITLTSYATDVAEIRGSVLRVFGLYSATTRKHISAFARQFGTDYSIAKKCYTDGIGYDIVLKEWVRA